MRKKIMNESKYKYTDKTPSEIMNLEREELSRLRAKSIKDLTYNEKDRAMTEQNDENSRPEIENDIDISGYNTIYLGFPIWFNYNPRIIYTLLDKYDFSGKTIIPFCTSGSSDITDSVTALRNNYSNLTIKDGKRFAGDASDEEIEKFVNENSNN